MRQLFRKLNVACILLALFAAGAWAQSSYTAAARGTVTDPSGAGVPGAKVALIEADRGVTHPATTDPAGRYSVTALPPGRYALTVEVAGFKKYTQTDIPLAVQQHARSC